jgi:hypothetical protein
MAIADFKITNAINKTGDIGIGRCKGWFHGVSRSFDFGASGAWHWPGVARYHNQRLASATHLRRYTTVDSSHQKLKT